MTNKPETKILRTAKEALAYALEVELAGYRPVRTTVRTQAGIRNHVVMVFKRRLLCKAETSS